MGYFEKYKRVVNEFEILPEDQWNFDETGYQIGIGRDGWVITVAFFILYEESTQNVRIIESFLQQ